MEFLSTTIEIPPSNLANKVPEGYLQALNHLGGDDSVFHSFVVGRAELVSLEKEVKLPPFLYFIMLYIKQFCRFTFLK